MSQILKRKGLFFNVEYYCKTFRSLKIISENIAIIILNTSATITLPRNQVNSSIIDYPKFILNIFNFIFSS